MCMCIFSANEQLATTLKDDLIDSGSGILQHWEVCTQYKKKASFFSFLGHTLTRGVAELNWAELTRSLASDITTPRMKPQTWRLTCRWKVQHLMWSRDTIRSYYCENQWNNLKNSKKKNLSVITLTEHAQCQSDDDHQLNLKSLKLSLKWIANAIEQKHLNKMIINTFCFLFFCRRAFRKIPLFFSQLHFKVSLAKLDFCDLLLQSPQFTSSSSSSSSSSSRMKLKLLFHFLVPPTQQQSSDSCCLIEWTCWVYSYNFKYSQLK